MNEELKEARYVMVVDVYFEELRPGGTVAGRSNNNVMVQVDGSEELLGKKVPVKITDAGRLSNFGVLIA